MIKELIFVMLLTFIPILELRYSIPAGILAGKVALPLGLSLVGYGLPWYAVFLAASVANIFVGIFVYFVLDKVVRYFLHFRWFFKFYHKNLERAQKKVKKTVDRYGSLGVAIFIGVPLPGTGVYTAAVGSYALGMSFKKFIIADILGVLISATLVTLLTLGLIAL